MLSSRHILLCSLNWFAGTSFIQVSHSHSSSLSSSAMVCKSLIVTGSMSLLKFNGIIYNTDERTISFDIGIVYPFSGRSIAINLQMPWLPLDAFANSNAPFCDFNLNRFLNSQCQYFVFHHIIQKVCILTIPNPINKELYEGMGRDPSTLKITKMPPTKIKIPH